MTWLAPKLNKRVQIIIPTQDPNDDGGFDLEFESPLSTVWMGFKPVKFKGAESDYIRGEQINEAISHEFLARKLSVNACGITDFMPLKTNYFLFLEKTSSTKGRLFRVRGVRNVEEQDEYLIIKVEEIEERGTGYPE